MRRLTRADMGRIEDAIRQAETGTAGEIVLVVAAQAASYRSVPLLYALAVALAAPWPLLLWTGWTTAEIALVQLAASVLALGAATPRRWRPGLLPAALRRARAREAAEREFRARGLAETRGRTGILLFVAQAEHHAEVIGDVAIRDRVAESEWRGVVDAMVGGFASGQPADGLVEAVARAGAILARHVPPEAGDRDELPNRVVLI